jgi:PAS domain S-box-containing protein
MKKITKTRKQILDEITESRRKIKAFEQASLNTRQSNQAFGQNEELFRTLVEHASEAILVIQDDKIRYVNQKASEIIGYSKKELASTVFDQFVHPDDRTLIGFNDIRKPNSERRVKHVTCRVINKTGIARWVDAKFLRTKLAEKIAVMGFLRDITERKAAEEALRFSEAKYRQLVEYAPAGIYEVDMTTGNFSSVNNVMCEYTGYTKEEFLNLKVWDLLEGKSREILLERYEKILKGERVPEETEYEIVGKNNKKISFLVYTRIEYKDGKPVRTTTVAHDITVMKKLEEELSKTRKLESLGVLSGGIGHDFNNLLSGIIGNISLAKLETERGENAMASLDEALRVTAKASALTRQLLVFSKGGAPIKKAASIAEVLRDSADFTLRGSKVKCEFYIEEDLWPVKVDVGQFSQVIHNLVINALQAMSKGGAIKLRAGNITLETVANMPLEPGRYVEIQIQDQGNGVAPENLPKIFDPYFTTKPRGSGLGLTMSYSIIKRHDGHITVESEPGKGTLFRIFLPATKEVPAKSEVAASHAVKGEGRILVMDDEYDLRIVAERMLLKLGYEAACVRDGTEALERYEKSWQTGQAFDAVIMDSTVPGGMGAKETIKKLLKFDPAAVVVVSSSYSDDSIISGYEKYGFKGMVTKPYRIEQLSWVMRDVLSADKK